MITNSVNVNYFLIKKVIKQTNIKYSSDIVGFFYTFTRRCQIEEGQRNRISQKLQLNKNWVAKIRGKLWPHLAFWPLFAMLGTFLISISSYFKVQIHQGEQRMTIAPLLIRAKEGTNV